MGEKNILFNQNPRYMYIRLIRNAPKGNSITGRLVIDGRWFCNTLERVGYEIPALCYHVTVTMSPKFKRLLPLVTGVPRSVESCRIVQCGVELSSTDKTTLRHTTQITLRTGIRFHRGSRPEHSTGCILVVADNVAGVHNKDNSNNPIARPTLALAMAEDVISPLPLSNVGEAELLSMLSSSRNTPPVGCRSAAEVEQALTQLLLKAQQAHEEIILEVTDFRPGTEYGYDHPCEPELQKP